MKPDPTKIIYWPTGECITLHNESDKDRGIALCFILWRVDVWHIMWARNVYIWICIAGNVYVWIQSKFLWDVCFKETAMLLFPVGFHQARAFKISSKARNTSEMENQSLDIIPWHNLKTPVEHMGGELIYHDAVHIHAIWSYCPRIPRFSSVTKWTNHKLLKVTYSTVLIIAEDLGRQWVALCRQFVLRNIFIHPPPLLLWHGDIHFFKVYLVGF